MDRRSILVVLTVVLGGCVSSRPPPIAPEPPDPWTDPVVVDDGRPDPVPRSVRRLLAEQKERMDEIHSLVVVVGDARGRVRAAAQANELAVELSRVEAAIDATDGDSDRLDVSVVDLRRLAGKIEILREALRTASL